MKKISHRGRTQTYFYYTRITQLAFAFIFIIVNKIFSDSEYIKLVPNEKEKTVLNQINSVVDINELRKNLKSDNRLYREATITKLSSINTSESIQVLLEHFKNLPYNPHPNIECLINPDKIDIIAVLSNNPSIVTGEALLDLFSWYQKNTPASDKKNSCSQEYLTLGTEILEKLNQCPFSNKIAVQKLNEEIFKTATYPDDFRNAIKEAYFLNEIKDKDTETQINFLFNQITTNTNSASVESKTNAVLLRLFNNYKVEDYKYFIPLQKKIKPGTFWYNFFEARIKNMPSKNN
jgi:hypothetical protein